jgi:hypothetical protein
VRQQELEEVVVAVGRVRELDFDGDFALFEIEAQ